MHVVATAGHVDHGKSTLVRALTGMEPDRWAEERRRGMTIDLGYAWTALDDRTTVAFVDVPGHQRFITNMLAGIGPVPAVLLVVAADAGWARQTGEHVAALHALGVTHGVLAATRADLGDAELAIDEARSHLVDTSLADVEAVAVSPIAGTGLTELRSALGRMIERLPAPPLDYTRLWIDRVFTIRGAGTVVTGTLGAGRIAVGDELTVAGTGEVVHVRGIESLKEPVGRVSAVARVALNLRGARRHDLRRGDALVGLREWIDTDTIDVRFSSPIDRPPAQLIVHVGSAAVPARVRPFDALTARLRMARTLPLHVGERVILRDPGPQRVTAGALVLDVLPPPLPRRSGATAARARELTAMSGRSDAAGELSRRRVLRIADLRASGAQPLPLPTGAVTVGDWLVAADRWADWRSSLIAIVRGWAEQHPLQPGMPRTALSKALGLPDPGIAERLITGLDDVVSDADGVHLRRAAAVVPPPIRRALDQLGRRLAARPFDAPEANELAAAGLSERFLAIATKSGELVRITTGVYLRPDALTHAALVLAELPAPFTLSAARQALGTTRRVAVPLLELLDTRRITRRVDDQRRVVVDRG